MLRPAQPITESRARLERNSAGTVDARRRRRKPTSLMSGRAGQSASDVRPSVSICCEIIRELVAATNTSEVSSAGKQNGQDQATNLRGNDRRAGSVIESYLSTGNVSYIRDRVGKS